MSTTTDLGNSANWEFVVSESRSAVVISPGQHVAIPKIKIPILLDKPVIAVRIDSSSAKPSWRFAGDLFQEISLGILVGGTPDAIASRRRAWLNQLCLFFLPSLSTTYALTYLPPKWFLDASISVWEYAGVDPTDAGADLTALATQLTQVEQKIDSLL